MEEKRETLVSCPCCGEGMVEAGHEFDICEVCGWEDDNFQFAHPDYRGGANKMSLNEARAAWQAKKKEKAA